MRTRDPMTGQLYDAGAGHAIAPTQVPRYPVSPTVGGVEVGAFKFDDSGAGSTTFIEARAMFFTDQNGSDAIAADRIELLTNGAKRIFPETVQPFSVMADGSEGEITDAYLLVVGSANIASKVFRWANAVDVAIGGVVVQNRTAAGILTAAAMIHFEFSPSDKVRHFKIGCGPLRDSDRIADLHIQGYGYGD